MDLYITLRANISHGKSSSHDGSVQLKWNSGPPKWVPHLCGQCHSYGTSGLPLWADRCSSALCLEAHHWAVPPKVLACSAARHHGNRACSFELDIGNVTYYRFNYLLMNSDTQCWDIWRICGWFSYLQQSLAQSNNIPLHKDLGWEKKQQL